MWYSIYYVFIGVTAAEIITLLREREITCVVSEEDAAKSAIYIDPPINSGFIQHAVDADKWLIDDWIFLKSTDSDHSVVTDKRWKDFKTLNGDVGHVLKNKSFSFSICFSGTITLNTFAKDFSDSNERNITPSDTNFSQEKSTCRWYHYTIVKANTAIHLFLEGGAVEIYELGFDPYWIYFKSPSDKDIFWKLHDYEFRAATTTTQANESKIAVTFAENLCLAFYVSIDRGCFLEINLELNGNKTQKTVIGTNELNSFKNWQKIEIRAETPGEGHLSFYRGRMQQGNNNGYWAIDEITFCNKDVETYRVELTNEPPTDHVCKVLSSNEPSPAQNILACEKPGFLGKNCKIGCRAILGDSYPYCENHKICQSRVACFCSWGYQGTFCNQTCNEDTWGLFCKDKCNLESECQKCNASTGECLKNEDMRHNESLVIKTIVKQLTEEDLPTEIEIASSKIYFSLPNFSTEIDEKIIYTIGYKCVSNWCRNEIIKNDTITIDSANRTKLLTSKFEVVPFTLYEATVTANMLDQVIKKKYNMSNTEERLSPLLENLSVFCRNSSSLWVRFSVSESENVDLSPYRIWYYQSSSKVPPKYVNASRCDLWNGFICGRIDNLEPEVRYSIKVETSETDREYQKNGFSETFSGFTVQSAPQAPGNLRISWSKTNKAELRWSHPFVTNGPVRKFLIEVETTDMIENYAFEVIKPQKIYEYKLPVNYTTQYIISVSAFNIFEGEKSRISATFFPIHPEYLSTTDVLVETCYTSCHFLVPKPIPLQNGSNTEIMGIPGHEKKSNALDTFKIMKNQKREIEGCRIFEKVDYDENYFFVQTGNGLDKAIPLRKNRDYSLYLVLTDNSSNYSVYSVGIQQKKSQDLASPTMLLTSMPYLTAVIITIVLSFLLVGLLVFKLEEKRKRKIRHHQAQPEERKKFILTNNPIQDNFAKIENRFLESSLKHGLLSCQELIAQFRSLRTKRRPTIHALSNRNKIKNKDQDNVPYDHNRVVLRPMQGMGTDDYINASYIHGLDRSKTYIATQGPKFSRDFWIMVWQEKAETIVMAANFVENKQRKCVEYFPQSINATFECGEMLIKLTHEEIYEHYISRLFEVYYEGSIRTVQHLHLRWNPDDLSPLYPNCLVPLVKRISTIREKNSTPIVIHCSSGANRTGTLILCDLALHMAKSKDKVDFHKLLKRMKEQRPNMISSEKQYILAYLIVLECLMEQEKVLKKSLKENFRTSVLKNQLDFLKRLQWHDGIVQSWIPDHSYLKNGSFYPVDGYATRKKFLTTRLPTKDCLRYFWETVIQEDIYTVVLLNKGEEQMWPYQSQNAATLTLKELQTVTTTYCRYAKLLLRIFQLPSNDIIFERTVDLFEVNNDALEIQSLNEFLNVSDDIRNFHKGKPILVACNDGVTNSGLYVALDYIIEKYISELDVDICNSLRTVRRSGIPFVNDSAQLEVLYKAVSEYLEKYAEYSSLL